MSTIVRFEEIQAWQTARELTRLVYGLSGQGAFSKDFGLRDQIRRAAVSVMSDIAEGFENQTQAQFMRYLGLAKGSAGEVRSQAYVALDLQYITPEEFKILFDPADKNARQLVRFITYLELHPQAQHVREDSSDYEV
ncbi:MAG: four helix bundle protein [Chloroflexi bacterium]|nr:MAG: four helix bundle protein [Chloroflexota bacterium]